MPSERVKIRLSSPIQFIKGVGPHLAGPLAKLGITTLNDFLYFFPKRYDDRRVARAFTLLHPNQIQSTWGIIVSCTDSQTKTGKTIVRAVITDGRNQIEAVWFNQPYLKKSLKPGHWVWLYGRWDYNDFLGRWELSVSDHELASPETYKSQLGLGSIVPIYPTTHGISAYKLRQLSYTVITQNILSELQEPYPPSLLEKFELSPISIAIQELHFPTGKPTYLAARKRIVFDDFFYFQLSLARHRLEWKKIPKAPQLQTKGPLFQAYLDHLPYTLTGGQKNAVDEIYADLSKPYRMNRLLQGDVGCGKTDVATLALLAAIENNYSGALMAPTEILAQQHYLKLSNALSHLDIEIVLLKGSLTAKNRQTQLAKILTPGPKIVIGTHALIEADVAIPNLAVIVIDEQHRFGVHQRLKLQDKGIFPHCLLMTATPIPRSLMLTCFGDLDKSVISELPPGRTPIETKLCSPSQVQKIYHHCRELIHEGRQVYVVYPLVQESEKLDLKSAEEGFEAFKTIVFPDLSVGMVHGKMKPAEKEAVMAAFKRGEISILVSTTVIEVGVDVPNASLMIIMHAERFGLAQLHQLRGRIGRGAFSSWCYLVPTSAEGRHNPRLKAMVATQNGFELAQIDLNLRGPGDLLGKRQSGLPLFKLADLARDEAVLQLARKAAFHLIQNDPLLRDPQNLGIRSEANFRFHDLFPPN